MASVRDSAEVKLVGFEQGVNVKTLEQIRSQTRARFHPLANPKVVINDKSDKKPSVTLRVRDIPTDPGDGQYNLHIESFKGPSHDIKIRVVDNYQARTTLTINNTITKALFDSGNSGALHNKNVKLIDSEGKELTLTLDFNVSRTTRNSASSWSVKISGVDNASDASVRTGIAEVFEKAINQIYSDEDLSILASRTPGSNIVTLIQKNTGDKGNTSTSGTLIAAGYASLPFFSTGKNGLLRTLNTGTITHPRDNTTFALGLKDPPGYYVGEVDSSGNDVGGNAVPYADLINSNSQKIKRITFDINNIINYQASSGITSRIIQDDTLLLTQEVKGSSVESGIGKTVEQFGLDNKGLLTSSFGLENWRLTSKEASDFVYHDIFTEARRFDASSRSSKIKIKQPDLDIYAKNIALSENFLEIEYDTLNEKVPNNPVFNTNSVNKIKFFVSNDSEIGSANKIRNKVDEKTIEVHINPFVAHFAGSDSQEALRFRESLFENRLARSLRDLSIGSPIILSLKSLGNKEYEIEIFENKSRLTYFQAKSSTKALSTNRDMFVNISGNYSDWEGEDISIEIVDGDNDTKALVLHPDRSIYGAKRKNSTFLNNIANNFGVYHYNFGIKEAKSTQDIKNRIFDAIYMAKESGEVDLNPTMRNSYARIGVSNGSHAHGTTPVSDRISITSFSGKTITYSIVHGGRSGSKAEKTGTILRDGSRVSNGTTISSGNAAIGTVAVNIKDIATKRDVLAELALAINSPNGNNGEERQEVIKTGGVDPTANSAQYLHLKSSKFGEDGNKLITKNGFGILSIIGFRGADDYISTKSIKLQNSNDRGSPKLFFLSRRAKELFGTGNLAEENVYSIDDFSDPVVTIEFKDGSDQNSYYTKPNHDLEVRSFGFSQRTSDLKHYEDLSLNGPKLDLKASYKRTLDIDPVFFVKADSQVRFPVQVNNLGSVVGFECDGVIEPLDIREVMLGRVISEGPIRGLHGEMGGEYSFSSLRKEASVINNDISFEKSKNVAFFDNCPGISNYISSDYDSGLEFLDRAETIFKRSNIFYSRAPGVIFKNDSKIQPYIDTEERVFQTNPLNGNNPETNEMDLLVLTLQEMSSNVNNMITTDDKNLGGENFRRKAGFDYSSPHPGTDSIVFSGLRYV